MRTDSLMAAARWRASSAVRFSTEVLGAPWASLIRRPVAKIATTPPREVSKIAIAKTPDHRVEGLSAGVAARCQHPLRAYMDQNDR